MSFKRELAISIPILIVVALVASHLAVVPTGSMAPSINEGDMVLVEKVEVLGLFGELDPGTIKEGDIIIYEESGSSPGEEASTSQEETSTSEASTSHEEASSTSEAPNSSEEAPSQEDESSHGGETIIHRVVAIKESNGEKYFILKGDANHNPDEEKVHPEDVEGRILTWNGNPITIPQVGWLILWFK